MNNTAEVVNFKGDTNKDGIVIKCKSGFNYYKGNNDSSLEPIVVAKDYTRSKDGTSLVKTTKIYEPVVVATNTVTYTIFPDGSQKVEPN